MEPAIKTRFQKLGNPSVTVDFTASICGDISLYFVKVSRSHGPVAISPIAYIESSGPRTKSEEKACLAS